MPLPLGPLHAEPPLLEINVLPPQGHHLATPKPRLAAEKEGDAFEQLLGWRRYR
jgi:hypothetical protein